MQVRHRMPTSTKAILAIVCFLLAIALAGMFLAGCAELKNATNTPLKRWALATKSVSAAQRELSAEYRAGTLTDEQFAATNPYAQAARVALAVMYSSAKAGDTARFDEAEKTVQQNLTMLTTERAALASPQEPVITEDPGPPVAPIEGQD